MYTEIEKSMFSERRQKVAAIASTVAAFAVTVPGAYFALTAGSVLRTLIAAVGTEVVANKAAEIAEGIAFRIGR